MINHRNIVFGFVVLLAVVALAGCSSTTAKPEASSTAAVSPLTEAKKQLASAPRDSTTTSSLDALQRGESTATPASSPLKEVYFDFDRYDLRADARETLKANWEWLKANPAAQVQIEGHCDERGTTEYNMALGAKRAQSVKTIWSHWGLLPIGSRRSVTVKNFLSVENPMKSAGKKTAALDLSFNLSGPLLSINPSVNASRPFLRPYGAGNILFRYTARETSC